MTRRILIIAVTSLCLLFVLAYQSYSQTVNTDVQETVSVSDTVNINVYPVVEINISETVGVADSAGSLLSVMINVSESIGVSDSVVTDVLPVAEIDVAEAITVSDSVETLPSVLITISELVAVSDSVDTEILPVIEINLSETVSVSDSVEALPSVMISISESIGVTDSPGAQPSAWIDVNEAITVSDTVSAGPLTAEINVAETITVSDSVETLLSVMITISEPVAVSDSVNTDTVPVVEINVSEAISVSDAVETLPSVMISISESIGVTDSVGTLPSVMISISENIGVSDTVAADVPSVIEIDVIETITVSDSVEMLPAVMINVSEPIAVSDSVTTDTQPVIEISISETISVSDSVEALPSVMITISEPVTVSDSVTADVLTAIEINVNETITVSDSVGALPAVMINVSEPIVVSDSVTTDTQHLVEINISETISVSDSVEVLPSVMINVSELINVIDHIEVLPLFLSVTGSGYNYPEEGFSASLSLDIVSDSMETGWLSYYYTRMRLSLESTLITGLSINGNTVTITGEGTVNGAEGYTFEVTITEENPDLMAIVIYGPDGSIYFQSGPTALQSGDFAINSGVTVTFNLTTSVNPPLSGSISPDCSDVCAYDSGILITLTASESSGYGFSGWTGCDETSGENICIMTMDVDKELTANFSGCLSPIRIDGATPVYYPTIQEAVNAAQDGEVVQVQEGTFTENINVNKDVSIKLMGGYGCNYSVVIGTTTVQGNININNGTMEIGDVEITPCDGLCPDGATIAFYKFEEDTVGISYDSSGNGNDGIDTETTVVPSPWGRARQFDGINDMIDISAARVALDYATDFSVEFLGRSLTGSQLPEMYGGACEGSWEVSVYATIIQYGVKLYPSGWCNWTALSGLTPGMNHGLVNLDTLWHYYALTWNGTTLSLYRDAALLASWPVSGTFRNTYPTSDLQLIGKNAYWNTYTSGIIDEVRISNIARDSDSIQNTWNELNAQIDSYSLAVTWTGSGSGTVNSSTGNISCPGSCSDVFVEGTQVILTPSADVGSYFNGWGDVICAPFGTNDCVITVNSDYTANADFCLDTDGDTVCNNVDTCTDADGDGYGVGPDISGCSGSKTAADFNDSDPLSHPGATEICDGVDNNGNGSVDENVTRQSACGVGECQGNTGTETCTAGTWGNDTCDPLAGATVETCDNLDNDCDGSVDDNVTRQSTCGVGECQGNTGTETCTAGTWGDDTCDPLAGSTPEICDNLDNDCDGPVDEGLTCQPPNYHAWVWGGFADDCLGCFVTIDTADNTDFLLSDTMSIAKTSWYGAPYDPTMGRVNGSVDMSSYSLRAETYYSRAPKSNAFGEILDTYSFYDMNDPTATGTIAIWVDFSYSVSIVGPGIFTALYASLNSNGGNVGSVKSSGTGTLSKYLTVPLGGNGVEIRTRVEVHASGSNEFIDANVTLSFRPVYPAINDLAVSSAGGYNQ